MTLLPEILRLESDPVARNKCIANAFLRKGSLLLSDESFASALLHKEKGKRCDSCFRHGQRLPNHLKKCSGCGCYWYCDTQCQNTHWAQNHKRICRIYNLYVASGLYQALPEHEKLDTLLLSYTISRLSLLPTPYDPPNDSQASVLMSLLPHPSENPSPPPIIPINPSPPKDLVHEIYAGFGNNNFVIHSHLSSVGHGVFPLVSRLFNHSCVPNAVTKYIFSPGTSPVMQIVAIRDIQPGEEIFIPYLDPALSETRGKIFQISYGFNCECSSCIFINPLLPLPRIPNDESELTRLANQFRNFAGIHLGINSLPTPQLEKISPPLLCVLREDYISRISEDFSKASHEGDYGLAINAGLTLLALYVVIYPPNYPQIGMHLLELSKTAWNARFSTDVSAAEEQVVRERVRTFLVMAREVLVLYGPEGDEGGPISEIKILEGLLSLGE